ncbi:hypothetical protein ABUE34_12060 [Kozakia baliensis]|uniref:hypothetical protein n=1 Tax=Kozakia baliensis TaxID=153496 RepID=UPI00345C1447
MHYLCRKPGASGELVYPDELPENYQTLGSFFLGGSDSTGFDETYIFHAYREGAVIPLELRRTSASILLAHADGIGDFAFRAVQSGLPARYTGNYPFLDEELVRQLAPRDRAALEDAAQSKDFFFVGYSPRLDRPVPPPTPDQTDSPQERVGPRHS